MPHSVKGQLEEVYRAVSDTTGASSDTESASAGGGGGSSLNDSGREAQEGHVGEAKPKMQVRNLRVSKLSLYLVN